MINKIIQLSKILIMDYYQKLDIYDKKTKKINFRKSFTWLLIITTILITFLSYKIISFLMDRGIALIFFKIYFCSSIFVSFPFDFIIELSSNQVKLFTFSLYF